LKRTLVAVAAEEVAAEGVAVDEVAMGAEVVFPVQGLPVVGVFLPGALPGVGKGKQPVSLV